MLLFVFVCFTNFHFQILRLFERFLVACSIFRIFMLNSSNSNAIFNQKPLKKASNPKMKISETNQYKEFHSIFSVI